MSDDIDNGIEDDTSAAIEALEVEAGKKGGKDRSNRHAPAGFDPAAVFLLGLGWQNLFEQQGAAKAKCKGCGAIVLLSKRQAHYAKHKRDSEKPLPKTNTTPTQRKEPTMAKNGNDKKPGKTKTAREVALRVLKQANKPMLMADIIAKVMQDAKIKEAGVPDRTVAAQINFEMAEEKPRIVRVDRGVYAHVDAADKTPPVREDATPKRSTTARKAGSTGRKNGAAKKTSTAKSGTAKSGTAKRGSTAKSGTATHKRSSARSAPKDLAKAAKPDAKPSAKKAAAK